jgi:hypothetical protein
LRGRVFRFEFDQCFVGVAGLVHLAQLHLMKAKIAERKRELRVRGYGVSKN